MSFYTRPILEDDQFKQLSGSTLTLSGSTDFVGTLKSKGIEIDASYTGTTASNVGKALALDENGIIKLQDVEGADLSFDSSRTTTRDDIPQVNIGGTTIGEFLEGYFFPAIAPAASISISSGGNNREFGDNTIGLLAWSVVKNTNLITSINIFPHDDLTSTSIAVGGGGSQNGTLGYTVLSSKYNPSVGTNIKEGNYKIIVSDGQTTPTEANSKITWRHNAFWFGDTNLYNSLDPASVTLLSNKIKSVSTSKILTTTLQRTISVTLNNQYFYYATPTFLGIPKFKVNGLPNTAWGNSTINTLYNISFVNSHNYTENYTICRSDSKITGTYEIIITI